MKTLLRRLPGNIGDQMKLTICLLAALLLAGCSEGRAPIGPSPITAVQPMASHGLPSGHPSITHVSIANFADAQPSGDPNAPCNFGVPQNLVANVNSGKVDVDHRLVFNVTEYEWVFDRWAGSRWELFDRVVAVPPASWYGPTGPDRFRLRVRSLVCGNQGTWSEHVEFSVDRAAPPAPPIAGPPFMTPGGPFVPLPGFEVKPPLRFPRLPVETPASCFTCHLSEE